MMLDDDYSDCKSFEYTDCELSDEEYSSEEEQPSTEDLEEIAETKKLINKSFPKEIIPFEHLRVTTITLKVNFEGEINIADTFLFLPLTYFIPNDREYGKFPFAGSFGKIISLRYRNLTRGLHKKKSNKKKGKNSFKNALTLDISSYTKNFSVKIYKSKIQICGVQNEEEVKPVFDHLISLIEHINENILFVRQNPELAERTAAWVRQVTYSNKKEREIAQRYYLANTKQYFVIYSDLHPSVSHCQPKSFPANIDPQFATFLLSLRDYEIKHHQTFDEKISYLLRSPPLIVEPVKYIGYYKYMINYNFSLGFPINRMFLHRSLREYNVQSHYDNNLSPSVNINILCKNILPITKKTKRISFLIYRSGSITLSGPCKDAMHAAYYRMIDLIREIVYYKK